jgi:alcohol dehydrogenase
VSGFAEHTVVAEASVVPVPSDLPPEQATLFGCATLTGVGAVLNTAQAGPGDSVVVFGLGGVGLAAVMGARLAGCHPVVAVDRVPSKVELALKVGASDGLVADADVVSAVRELTHGGADFSFEAAGSAAVLTSAYAATRRGGMTVAVGLPHPHEQLQVPAVGIVAEERRLVGSYMGSAVPRRDVPKYVRMFRAGMLPIDALGSGLLSLEEINGGFDALASAESVRQVIVIDSAG